MLASGDNVTQITANISDGHETEADKQTVQAKHSHRLLVFIPGHKTINRKSFPVPCSCVKGVYVVVQVKVVKAFLLLP